MVVDTLVESVGPFLVPILLFFAGVVFYVLLWLYQR
jgi:hypothetical protein